MVGAGALPAGQDFRFADGQIRFHGDGRVRVRQIERRLEIHWVCGSVPVGVVWARYTAGHYVVAPGDCLRGVAAVGGVGSWL